MVSKAQIETITKHYLIAMLWTMPGDDDCENPGDDIALLHLPRETIKAARHDVTRFVASCGKLFDAAMACYNNGYGQHPAAGSAEAAFGHDFALTRNGHGVGFLDRDSEGLPRVLGEALTRICKCFPERNLYIGDDGRAYFDQGFFSELFKVVQPEGKRGHSEKIYVINGKAGLKVEYNSNVEVKQLEIV